MMHVVYAALALWSMPKLIMASSPFTRSRYTSSYGYECPTQHFSTRYKYVNGVRFPYQWCLKRPVIYGSASLRSVLCEKEITRYGSILDVSYAGRRSSSSRFKIQSSSLTQKYSQSKLPNCERVSPGDRISWADTSQSHKLSLYVCFSNSSCPLAATTKPFHQHHSDSDFWGSWWFYPLIGVTIVLAVGCSIYRRARLRQAHANARRLQMVAANAGGVAVVTTTTTVKNAPPVCALATAAPVVVAQPGGSMPAAYPVATATAQPMPQAVAQPAMAQAVAHPVGVGATPVAVATATAVPMNSQPQVLL